MNVPVVKGELAVRVGKRREVIGLVIRSASVAFFADWPHAEKEQDAAINRKAYQCARDESLRHGLAVLTVKQDGHSEEDLAVFVDGHVLQHEARNYAAAFAS